MGTPKGTHAEAASDAGDAGDAADALGSRPMLGRYVVLGTLGQGGMGTVFEAFDRTLDRKVAVKVLHEEISREHTVRLLREAQAMAKLSHPNVVPVFEANTVDGQTFVVMELVQGQTLQHWIRQDPRPDWRQCVQVFIQAGQGLAAAHAAGLVHRDFKPSNVIIEHEGRARVLDFGLARWTEVGTTGANELSHKGGETNNDPSPGSLAPAPMSSGKIPARPNDQTVLDRALTKTGAVVGTPAYMPPEQMNRRQVDARSDQFSFCVSLYEAVYGERPFAGQTLAELRASITHGTLRGAPSASPVPAQLRAIVLRGLALEPEQRWPSMEALLAALHGLVARRTRRWMAMGVTIGLVALGGGLALGHYAQVKERCTGAQAQMDGIWDDARRQQVQAALLGTERSFAASTWARIEPPLSAYADAWMQTHTAACEATSVRGEQSEETLDLRMRCLDERRAALRATVNVLADADAEVVSNAVKLVAGLPPLTHCDDFSWLEQQDRQVPPPEDPAVAEAVVAQRARLMETRAMQKAGRYAEALAAIEVVVEQAEVLEYPPFRAEALHRRGSLRRSNGQYAEAEEDLRQAYALAVSHQHDSVALDTARALTSVVGSGLARHAEGQQWGETVALPLAERSGEPTQHAYSFNALGNVFHSKGDYQSARHHYQRALEIWEKTHGSDHLHTANILGNLGNVLSRQGDYQSAKHHYQRALAIREKVLGPDHPRVATTLNNLGTVFSMQGDHENTWHHHEQALMIQEKALISDHPLIATTLNNLGIIFEFRGDYEHAQQHYQRALAIWEKTHGPDHPDVARGLGNLGNVLESRGDYENARHHFERALAIWEKTHGPDHPDMAMGLDSLGILCVKQGDYQSARAHHQRALAIREKALGPDHTHVAMSLVNLGNLFVSRGEHERARGHLERALAINEKALGPDHPDVAYSLVGLATVALETGDPGSARAHAARAISIREAAAVAPQVLAEARFVLARAQWSTHGQRAQARTLAEHAREALAAAEGPDGSNVDLAEIDAWLATHRIK
ncbi:MAG: serine/threonine-protein kinase [Myxococcota bacterium]